MSGWYFLRVYSNEVGQLFPEQTKTGFRLEAKYPRLQSVTIKEKVQPWQSCHYKIVSLATWQMLNWTAYRNEPPKYCFKASREHQNAITEPLCGSLLFLHRCRVTSKSMGGPPFPLPLHAFLGQLPQKSWEQSGDITPQFLYRLAANGPFPHWHCSKVSILTMNMIEH